MSSELGIRSEVLRRLRQIPAGGGNGQPPVGIAHAEDFSAILRDLGLEFGHPVVDKIMVACSLDNNGWVDYRGFAREVDASQGNVKPRREGAVGGGAEKIVITRCQLFHAPQTSATQNNSRAIQMENGSMLSSSSSISSSSDNNSSNNSSNSNSDNNSSNSNSSTLARIRGASACFIHLDPAYPRPQTRTPQAPLIGPF